MLRLLEIQTNTQTIEKFQTVSEMITSAICDGYSIMALNTNKKGILNNNDIIKNFDFDIKNIAISTINCLVLRLSCAMSARPSTRSSGERFSRIQKTVDGSA